MSARIVIFVPNWLGDAVMALPAIADVRRALPDCTLHVAARPWVEPLVSLMQGTDGTVVLDNARSSIERLRAGSYDTAFLMTNSFNSARIAWSAGIRERWGYRNEFRSLLLTRAVHQPPRMHQTAYYQQLTSALGFTAGTPEPRLTISGERRARAADRLVEAGWDRTTPLVAVAPGAAFGGAKRWPAEHFASVIDALAADAPDGSGETRPGRGARSRAVLVGARADRMAADDVVTLVRTRPEPIDLVGATDLSLFAGVLSCCRALVTNDSGAMHLAAALGVDVVAIFGPTNEAETRPLGSGRLSVVHASTWCRPCMLRECPLTHACMRRVSSDRVTAEVRASL